MKKHLTPLANGATQSNYYYPYGLPTAMSSHPEVNRYKYGGKELETSHGLALYDFEARWHDPQTARFLQPDPMADDYPWLSPYAYCAGNPIRNIDPTGMDIWCLDEIGHTGISGDSALDSAIYHFL